MLGGSIKAKNIKTERDVYATNIDVKEDIRAGGNVSSATDLKARRVYADSVFGEVNSKRTGTGMGL